MEYYLYSCSAWSVYASYQEYLLTVDLAMKATLFAEIIKKCSPHFSGWLLFHINSVGSVGRKQMFYVTFVNHYFGLSRSGIEMNSAIGYGVTLGMYDRERRRHEELAKRRAAAVVDSKAYVQWWDNFSKFRSHSVPTIAKDVFATCLWTGITVNEYTGPPVNNTIQFNGDGDVIPAMPDDLFANEEVVLAGIDHIYNEGKLYYDKSMVKKYDIINIPLKVDTKRFPHLADTLNSSKNSTKHINPYKLIRHNIGSNLGLATILREFQDDNKMTMHNTVQSYSNVNTDENIFYRGLKVCGCVVCCVNCGLSKLWI